MGRSCISMDDVHTMQAHDSFESLHKNVVGGKEAKFQSEPGKYLLEVSGVGFINYEMFVLEFSVVD